MAHVVQNIPLSLYSVGSLVWRGLVAASLTVLGAASSTASAPGVRRNGLRIGMARTAATITGAERWGVWEGWLCTEL